MSEAPPSRAAASKEGPESEDLMRAKYLDYCSAQVAEVLLALSPDEIFVMAGGGEMAEASAASLSYDAMVRMATQRITERLVLPSFEIWAEEYRSDPQQFEDYLMGLWREEAGSS